MGGRFTSSGLPHPVAIRPLAAGVRSIQFNRPQFTRPEGLQPEFPKNDEHGESLGVRPERKESQSLFCDALSLPNRSLSLQTLSTNPPDALTTPDLLLNHLCSENFLAIWFNVS